jgi:hypothetical protein
MDSTEWQKKSEKTILKLTLNSNVKKIFLKASLRVEKFKQEAPSLSLPPKPVLTRWGTWLDAAMYYCENYSTIEKIVSELDRNEASSVKFVKELFYSDLSGKLAYIKSNFVVVSKTIACLEAVGVETNDALDIVKGTERAVEQSRDKVAENVKNKFKKVLERNCGFSVICKINGILCENGATLCEEDPALDSKDVTLFKYAPLTSRDVQRSFSTYKKILRDNRRSFSFENLKMHLVIHCNSARHED